MESDVALVDVEAVDEEGERCPTLQMPVNFTCSGPAVWRGGYDSGEAGSINKLNLDLECGINRVAVRATLKPGKVLVTANCPGLRPASLTIVSHSFPVTEGFSQIEPAMPAEALPIAHPDWSRLANATPPMTVTAASETATLVGRFMESFNYTGPTGLVHVEPRAEDGKNIYCDRDFPFNGLPKELSGADWIQAAASDCVYNAADLMQIGVQAGSTVYLAHDERLPQPDWLQRQFKPSGFLPLSSTASR